MLFAHSCRYEGGGINRPVQIVVSPKLHFVQGGVFPNPNSDGTALRVSTEIEDLDASKKRTYTHKTMSEAGGDFN